MELNPQKSAKFFPGDIRVKSLIHPDICRKKVADIIAVFFSRVTIEYRQASRHTHGSAPTVKEKTDVLCKAVLKNKNLFICSPELILYILLIQLLA